MDITRLSPAQRKVFDLLVEGLSNREIGDKIHLAEKTVKVHVTAIFKSLGCQRRTRVIAQYYAQYYLKLDHGMVKS
jgi:two-component system, NarL family, response regulator DevR